MAWSTPVFDNSKSKLVYFEDFIDGDPSGNGYPAGIYRQSGNNGGGTLGGTVGSIPAGVLGRVGLIGPATGTSANATGQGFLDCPYAQIYAGQTGLIYEFAAMIPTLSTASVEYVAELGFGSGYLSGGTSGVNAAFFQYKRTTSLNWNLVTANNSTQTVSGDSAAVVVTAAQWYDFRMIWHSDGTAIDFYVGNSGGNLSLLGTSSTNLPSISQQTNPVFNIFKASSTATSSSFQVDWAKFSFSNFAR